MARKRRKMRGKRVPGDKPVLPPRPGMPVMNPADMALERLQRHHGGEP